MDGQIVRTSFRYTSLTRRRLLTALGVAGAGLLAAACGGGQAQLPATKPPAASRADRPAPPDPAPS
jgi:hypothetical protein